MGEEGGTRSYPIVIGHSFFFWLLLFLLWLWLFLDAAGWLPCRVTWQRRNNEEELAGNNREMLLVISAVFQDGIQCPLITWLTETWSPE